MSGSDPVAEHSTIRGTWTLFSSAYDTPSLAPAGASHTAFTGALIELLRNGIPDGPDELDGGTILQALRQRLVPEGFPRPDQRNTDIGYKIAIARNRARGKQHPTSEDLKLPPPPPWRKGLYGTKPVPYQVTADEEHQINAALRLRRPLLVVGASRTGKSSLADSIAEQYRLGPVLRWRINKRSTLQEGLYYYDEVSRRDAVSLQNANDPMSKDPDIGSFVRLGPLGTALLPTDSPRILLIDDLDKSNIDLTDDLLDIFEADGFEIPELARLPASNISIRTYDGERAVISKGYIRFSSPPIMIITTGERREFSPEFLRWCIILHLRQPDSEMITRIIELHLGAGVLGSVRQTIIESLDRRHEEGLTVDQLLDAIYLDQSASEPSDETKAQLTAALLPFLVEPPSTSKASSGMRKESMNDSDYLADIGEESAASPKSGTDEEAAPRPSFGDSSASPSPVQSDKMDSDSADFELLGRAVHELAEQRSHVHEADGPLTPQAIDRLDGFLRSIDAWISSLSPEDQEIHVVLRACTEALAVARRQMRTAKFMSIEWERRKGDESRSSTSMGADYDSLLGRQGELETSLWELAKSMESLTELIATSS